MKVYEVTVTDKCSSPTGLTPAAYESYVAVDDENNGEMITDYDKFYKDLERETGFKDTQIHCYFTQDEWDKGLKDGVIDTEEFKYLVGGRKA